MFTQIKFTDLPEKFIVHFYPENLHVIKRIFMINGHFYARILSRLNAKFMQLCELKLHLAFQTSRTPDSCIILKITKWRDRRRVFC